MIHMRRMLLLLAGIITTVFLIAPAWASLMAPEPIARNVVVAAYQSALGGTIHISPNGGQSYEYVYAGPYEFNIYEAVQNGTGVSNGTLIDRLVAMYCDSASYDLMMSYSYVQLSGADVLNGYGRLYDHTSPATAEAAYLHMSWALQYAFSQNTQEWYKAAQIYTWELMSDAVYGDTFNLADGTFQVASSDRTPTLLKEVNDIYKYANTSVIASLNVPVTLLQNDSGALYSDTLSGATRYFKNSESSQEFLVGPTTPIPEDPTSPVPEPATLLLLTFGLVGLGRMAWGHRKS